MDHLYIGIDIGTSSAKVVLADASGVVVKQAAAEYQAACPRPGWSEIDPQVWYAAVAGCIRSVLAGAEASRVEAIGVTGQMHTTVFMDSSGASIRPALMWTDKRTQDDIPALKSQIAACPQIRGIANIISTGSPAANLYWLAQNEPENLRGLHKFLIGPDYIVFRLTGVFGTDFCEASTSSLFDIQNRCWSPDMRRIVGLAADVYPQVRGSAQFAGTLTRSAAAELGLAPGVRVIVGTGDNPAAAITTGCLGGGDPVISLGTSGVLMLSRPQPDFEAPGKNILFSLDGESFFYLVQGVVQSTGGATMWWVRDILELEDFSQISAHIDIARACESPLLFYPHLRGDKTLYADPTLSGAFIGLRAETTRWDMAYAVMEGISFAFRELAEKMRLPVNQYAAIRAAGGGAQSDIWLQTMADAMHVCIDQLDGSASASLAMALLAAHSCGRLSDLGGAAKSVMRVKRRFEPRPEKKSVFAKKYSQYLRIHGALADIKGE